MGPAEGGSRTAIPGFLLSQEYGNVDAGWAALWVSGGSRTAPTDAGRGGWLSRPLSMLRGDVLVGDVGVGDYLPHMSVFALEVEAAAVVLVVDVAVGA